MSDALTSKTILLLIFLSTKATVIVFVAAALDAWRGYHTPYVVELFGFESAMFVAVAAKNGYDNYVSRSYEYKQEISSQAIQAGQAPI